MKTIVEMKKLTNEQLIVLAKDGDNDAYEFLFERNQGLSVHVAMLYPKSIIPMDDRIQLANLGMIKAYNTFQADKNILFATYAFKIMKNEILMAVRKNKRTLNDYSIHYPISHTMEGEPITLEELLEAPTPDLDTDELLSYKVIIDTFMKNASERDKMLFQMHFIEDKTQRAIMNETGMQQSYVSRLIVAIKINLRQIAEHGYITERATDYNLKKFESVKRKKLNSAVVKYIFINYPYLKKREMAEILGAKTNTIEQHFSNFKKGKYDDIMPDGTVEPKVQEYLKKNKAI